MAEAKEISGLDCDSSAVDWATKVLHIRFSEVLDLHSAAKDFSAVESVHDMRVAIRRLRGAVRDFLPLLKKSSLKHIRKDLKQIADALGVVRDADVAIIALKKLRDGVSDEEIKAGIENLLTARETLREQSRLHLIEILTNKNSAPSQRDFEKTIQQAIKNSSLTFNQAGKSAVGESFNHFLKLGVSLYEPSKIKNLHELRIAAKRLRYALELFTACWGETIKIFADEIAAMQAALGEVHDCDVWIENTGAILRDDNSLDKSERHAAFWLLSEFTKKRTKHYRNSLKLWRDWEQNDFAPRMQAIIESVN